MKVRILIVSIIITLSASCKKNNVQSAIIGNWKLKETSWSDGGSDSGWYLRTENITISFNENGIFNSNGDIISSGNYSLNIENLLNITTNTGGTQNEKSYYIKIEDGYLYLDPHPIVCDEGCTDKYQKIIN